MKFKVSNKESGEFFKKKIFSEVNSDRNFISVAEVKEMFRQVPEDADWNHGWNRDFGGKKKSVRLRENKDGWYLYLPEPIVWYFKKDVVQNVRLEPEEDSLKCLDTICCRVISKSKKKPKEEMAFFYGVFQSSMPNKDGQLIQQPLALVIMAEDRAFRCVRPDHVVLGWEE